MMMMVAAIIVWFPPVVNNVSIDSDNVWVPIYASLIYWAIYAQFGLSELSLNGVLHTMKQELVFATTEKYMKSLHFNYRKCQVLGRGLLHQFSYVLLFS